MRDPRLVLGVMLVLGATVLGARLAAAGDDTVEYWSLGEEVRPGDQVLEEHLEPTRVKLSGAAADNYVRTDEELPGALTDLVWAHDLSSGSLVGKDALVSRASRTMSQLPLSVTDGAAPGDLARGDLVDVWVGPGPGDEPGARSLRVLESVRVLQTGDEAAASSGSLAQTVLVEVERDRLSRSVISTVAAGHVTLVRVP